MYFVIPKNFQAPVYLTDPNGKVLGTVCLARTKQGFTSMGFDFPKGYKFALQPKVVTPQLFGDCDQDEYSVPEDACNEF